MKREEKNKQFQVKQAGAQSWVTLCTVRRKTSVGWSRGCGWWRGDWSVRASVCLGVAVSIGQRSDCCAGIFLFLERGSMDSDMWGYARGLMTGEHQTRARRRLTCEIEWALPFKPHTFHGKTRDFCLTSKPHIVSEPPSAWIPWSSKTKALNSQSPTFKFCLYWGMTFDQRALVEKESPTTQILRFTVPQ